MRTERTIQVILQSPSERNTAFRLPASIAWTAARALAVETHNLVTLIGTYGRADFKDDGSAVVVWNELSTTPGESKKYDNRTSVMLN